MTFEEHLDNNRDADGNYDLAAAEADREAEILAELAENPDQLNRIAHKAAASERKAWETRNSNHLGKQVAQPALSESLELDAMVQIGGSTAVRLGDMNHVRIRSRKDLRTKVHLDESRTYVAEMDFWEQTERLLEDGETVAEAMDRSAVA